MSWTSYQKNHFRWNHLGLALDLNGLGLEVDAIDCMRSAMGDAFAAMNALEGGAIANPDENRMVGHYWLRDAARAPSDDIRRAITETRESLTAFARKVHSGEIKGQGGAFTDLLIVGIGGSALGPQFVAQALGRPGEDRLRVHFFDNTDPDGMDLTLANLRGRFATTLVLVISKSGGTPETRNGMLEAAHAFLGEGVEFASQAVAVTGEGSQLDKVAQAEDWLARFSMFDWVGGRTSETAAVGLLPAALQGLDIDGILKGAAAMDAQTRETTVEDNPAALLALAWYFATNGKGEKDMVILPYKDRLQLLSRYLQQLIMESLGKETDLDGNVVHQGIAVYGNKGSTDQHAYVQQLREGVPNFFATFISVLKDREGASLEVEPGVTSGDYLHALLLGTRAALLENDRASLTLTIEEVTPAAVGGLIALYERAVGFYASLVNINAYHQPGVEAGKKAAALFLKRQEQIVQHIGSSAGKGQTVEEIADALNLAGEEAALYGILVHMAANPAKGIHCAPGKNPAADRFSAS